MSFKLVGTPGLPAAVETGSTSKAARLTTFDSSAVDFSRPIGSYVTRVDWRAGGSSSSGTGIFGMVNNGNRTAFIDRIFLMMSYNPTTSTNSNFVVGLVRGVGYITSGTIGMPIRKRNSHPSPSLFDCRTGTTTALTITNVLLEAADFEIFSISRHVKELAVINKRFWNNSTSRPKIEIQPGQGVWLVHRTGGLVGDTLAGHIEWSEYNF